MTFWRNPEIKRQLIWYLAVSALLLLAAALCSGQVMAQESWQTGRKAELTAVGFTAAALAAAAVLHFAMTWRRYRRLAALSEQLDKILHGQGTLEFAEQEEGELSILQDEIRKMTVTLRQQADALKGEKQYLCDAITDMSHQLRTPLTSLNLIQAMLAGQELSPERRRELLMQQKVLLRRIDELLVVLLKMARIDAGAVSFQRMQVPAGQLVRQASEPLSIPMELRGLQLCCHGNEQVTLCIDAAWSAEALGNILKNCMEHTPGGGRIDVFWEENAVYIEVRVEDNGPGIDEEDLPHVLERFYKGKNQGEAGFGVGLAFARMVVAAQNGVLTAENRSQGGARFVMRFYKGVI